MKRKRELQTRVGDIGEVTLAPSWEANLRAEAIRPAYGADALDAAPGRGEEAYTVPEKLGFGPVGWAMGGCWLYADDAPGPWPSVP